MRFVGANNHNQGEVIGGSCGQELGAGPLGDISGLEVDGKNSKSNAIAAGGGEIFFTTHVLGSAKCGSPDGNQLFVRVGGSRTLEVSRPLESSQPFGGCGDGGNAGEVPGEVPCPGAASRAPVEFDGASEDGSRVFFATTAPLVGSDTSSNLYMATIGCPAGAGAACAAAGEAANTKVESLVQVSHDPNVGEAADVQGTVGLGPAADGSRVYFVARGVLTGAPSAGAQGYGAHGEAVSAGAVAQPGADNLYVFDAETQATSFIADLCSGPGLSGELSDDACPLDLNEGVSGGRQTINDAILWGQNPEAQAAGKGGGFLVFSSYGRLVANDTDSAQDVYRYDAETGQLERVSIGEAGADTNGNNSEYPSTIASAKDTRVVSEDGSRVVFTSAEPLSPDAVNGLANVYEWHRQPGWSEGRVSLISTGDFSEPVEHVAISQSGRDVFFVTNEGLVPQDTDGVGDVYDARLGGGFPPPPAPAEACAGDACQGPLTNPAPLLVPGSVSQAPGGNFAAPVPVTATTPKAKPATCKKGFVKKRGKCVKRPKAKKKQTKKSSHTNRRAK